MSDTKREKSNMELWAEEEIRIACERERGGASEDEWDYGVACYESALKAFRSLMEDEHSGMSIGITLNILNKLVKGLPLTQIEDTDDIWNLCGRYNEYQKYDTYQCKRMSSLFKDVYEDGHVVYTDTNRFTCVCVDSPDISWRNGQVSKIAGEYFPIEMPYTPKHYTVVCEEFLTNRKNGDCDTLGVLYICDGDKKVEVNRYFDGDGEGWCEIDLSEYEQRRRKANAREEAETANVEKK